MRATVHRKAYFNAAHRLFVKEWNDEQNFSVFGKCSNPHYHGHNYELITSVSGEIDPQTGFVIDLKILNDIINQEIKEKLDHKNLNLEVEEFKTLNPTVENIAVVIWSILRKHLKKDLDLEITLYETPRNYVTYKGL